jgi:hypothetical protein
MTAPRFVRWSPVLAGLELLRKPAGVRAWADFAGELDTVMPLVHEAIAEERRTEQWRVAAQLAATTAATLVTRDPLPSWEVGEVTVLCSYDQWRAYVTEAREHQQVPWRVTDTGVYLAEVDRALSLWLVAHGPRRPDVVVPLGVLADDPTEWAVPGAPAPRDRPETPPDVPHPGSVTVGASPADTVIANLDAALAAHAENSDPAVSTVTAAGAFAGTSTYRAWRWSEDSLAPDDIPDPFAPYRSQASPATSLLGGPGAPVPTVGLRIPGARA